MLEDRSDGGGRGAGTRGASDTVEVASQLLEYLAGDTRVFRGPLAAAALEQQAHSETTFSALDILKQVRPVTVLAVTARLRIENSPDHI